MLELLEPEPDAPETEEVPEPEPVDTDRMYWACLPEDMIAEAVNERIREYFKCLSMTGVLALWTSAHRAVYTLNESGQHEGSRIGEYGDQEEMLGVRSNQLRSIALYILTSATADRPAYSPKATNNTSAALAQIPLARTLLDYYHKRKGLENALIGTALRALVYGKGYLWLGWDPLVGPKLKGDPAKREGDLVIKSLSPLECVGDLDRKPGESDWQIVKTYRNKYDLVAQFASTAGTEELRDKLLDLEDEGVDGDLQLKQGLSLGRPHRETTDVAVWHLLHADTPAVPGGRYTITCGKDLCLFDGPLPFDEVPIYEMLPEEFLDAGSIGYSSIWDLMGLQEAYDGLNSTGLSNFDAFGTNDIMLPNGSEITSETVSGGLNVIRYPANTQPPAILEKFQLSESFFKLRSAFLQDMQLSSGVNSTVRGDPEANLKSGAALALIQAQAVQFQSRFQGSYVRLTENAGTGVIRILKKFATSERCSSIAGSYDTDALRSFKADDISHIDRVEVEAGSPMFRTVAGKFDIATQLLERGLIKDLNAYYQVLETGRLEPITDPARRAALRIQEENELLMKGPPIIPTGKFDELTGEPLMSVEGLPVVITQNPADHIRHAASVLDSADALANPSVVAAVTEHILEHLRVWREAPPDLLQLLGFPMPPPKPGDETQVVTPGAPEVEPKQDPNAGKNEQKAKAAGNNAPGSDRPVKLPRPAQPPPGSVQ